MKVCTLCTQGSHRVTLKQVEGWGEPTTYRASCSCGWKSPTVEARYADDHAFSVPLKALSSLFSHEVVVALLGGTVPDAATDKASREKAIAAALAHSGYQPAPGHLRDQVEAPPPQATTWQEVEKSLKEHKTLLGLLKQEEELALVAATVLPPQEVAIPEEARACYTYYQETLRYQDALLVDGLSQEDALASYTALISSFRKESS